MLYIKSFDIHSFEFWGVARKTVNEIIALGKLDNLQTHIEEVFDGCTPTASDINSYVWFNYTTIYDALGINSNNEE